MKGTPRVPRQAGFAVLEKEWQVQDWGEALDLNKIRLLDKLVRPEWCSWYAERLNETKMSRPSSPAHGSSDVMQTEITRETTSHTINHPAKTNRIADDEKQLARLSAISKTKRSKEQRVMLALIRNRKRNRQKFRAAKLLAEGITSDEVEKQGGVDELFEARGSRLKKSVSGGPSEKVVELENGSEMKRLKAMGMDSWIKTRGWEILNCDRMAKLLRRVICLYLEDS